MYQSKKELAIILALAAASVALMLLTSCATPYRIDDEGHWPGYLFEPHPAQGQEQIGLRNAYSDGWQDGIGAGKIINAERQRKG